jgi:hypothetical protein
VALVSTLIRKRPPAHSAGALRGELVLGEVRALIVVGPDEEEDFEEAWERAEDRDDAQGADR